MIVLVVVFAAAGFVAIRISLRPTVLEQEIRLDLIAKDKIDDTTRVVVLNELRLFSFYSKFGPQRFATLCLQEPDGSLQLAYARCWREGMFWFTDPKRWKQMAAWPNAQQIRTFEDEHADLVKRALDTGYRPRPPGSEDFELTDAVIQVSGNIGDFEPNEGVDARVLATALKNGMAPGTFAYADFHERHWHPPGEGVAAMEKSIEYVNIILDEPECQTMDCRALLKVLQAVKERLLRAEERNLKFCILGTDRRSD